MRVVVAVLLALGAPILLALLASWSSLGVFGLWELLLGLVLGVGLATAYWRKSKRRAPREIVR